MAVAIALIATGAAGAAQRRHRTGAILILVVVAGLASGHTGRVRDRPPPPLPAAGDLIVTGVAASDATGPIGQRRLVLTPTHRMVDGGWSPWRGPRVLVEGDVGSVAAAEPVAVQGSLRPAQFRTRSGWVGGVVAADTVTRLGEAASPLLRLGNRLRERVLGSLSGVGATPEVALVSGFLIGDTSSLPEADAEALRAAGLSHFVAVSGSNVGLFLAAWWLVSGPLAWSPRRRALVGLVGLGVFVVVTRWEPSVLRAAVMAGSVLTGRLVGRLVSPWAALGWSVTLLVLLDGRLTTRVGFQLSVAATAGILVGIPLWRERRPRWVWGALGATIAAQVAVAPLLLLHFGAVPLLAPITNLIAAPLVVAATMVGGVGAVLGAERVVAVAAAIAGLVLRMARGAADLPQLGVAAVVLVGAAGVLAAARAALRPILAAAALLVVMAGLIPPGPPDGPVVAFLDVGQGDAALLRGPSGEVILIDGGPDPARLRSHLRDAGVRHIDLLIITHRHADHTMGLVGLHLPVTAMWHPPQLGEGPPFDAVVATHTAAGAAVAVPEVGTTAVIGAFTLEVLGPVRRYVSPNDGSLVVRVTAVGVQVLFSGDIEAVAQADLGPLPCDVLKVPHQGAATSDIDWILASAPAVAVISVGRNDFGHPAPEVVAALEAAGSVVFRTDRDGTVTLRLDRMAAPLPSPR